MNRNRKVNDFKVIMFDLGNVIVGFDHSIATHKLATLTDKSSEEIYNLFFDSPLTQQYEEGAISSREFFSRVKTTLHLKALNFEEFISIWNDIFWENKEVSRLISDLKANYKIFIISNVNKSHFDFIKHHFEVIHQADSIILSFDVGARKPNPIIYEVAISRAKVEPQQIVYTDDREELIIAARNLGLTVLHFKGAEQLKRDLIELGVVVGRENKRCGEKCKF